MTNELATQIGMTKSAIFRSTWISLSIGFFILLLVVLAAEINLRRHRAKSIEHERELAAQELTTAKLDMTNRELQQIDEERTKFLSTVSHELKTPLTSIITLTELLEHGQSGTNKDRNVEQLHVISKSADHLLMMINELLDYSRLDSGEVKIEREEFVVEELVKEVESSMAPLLGSKTQSLKLYSDLGTQRVRLDRRRVLQLLMNLVSNASKYSEVGTKVSVGAWIVDQELHLAVVDQGVGISEQDQLRIYTKFFRGDNEATRLAKGTGLGLSITKELVEAHGGTIETASRVGFGTRFDVVIPTGMPNVPYFIELERRRKLGVLARYVPLRFSDTGRNI